jgi:outer membrane protein OmpA-like peptidoglycan-associated protein
MKSTPFGHRLKPAAVLFIAIGGFSGFSGIGGPASAGAQTPDGGAAGLSATHGAAGVVRQGDAPVTVRAAGVWTPFTAFDFGPTDAELAPTDAGKVADVVNYLNQHPDQQVRIAGTIAERGIDIGSRRIAAIREALLRAGVPLSRIQTGAFGSTRPAAGRRVELLVGAG